MRAFENGIDTIGQVPFPQNYVIKARNESRLTNDSNAIAAIYYNQITVSENEWLTFVLNGGQSIGVVRYKEAELDQLPVINLKKGEIAYTTTIIDGLVYIGGKLNDKPIIAVYELDKDRKVWAWKEIALEYIDVGKSIDALVKYGDLIIAVDNVVVTKYFIIFDISTPVKPQLLGKIRIPSHGVWEHIYRVAFNKTFLVTLSSTSGRMNYSQHLAIYELSSLKEVGIISNSKLANRFSNYQGLKTDTTVFWESIEFYGDTLIIGSGSHGIGMIDLSNLARKISSKAINDRLNVEETILSRLKRPSTIVDFFGKDEIKIDHNNVDYFYPSSLNAGRILNSWPLGKSGIICNLVITDDSIKTNLVRIHDLN